MNNKYEQLIFKDWIQLHEWNDPDWIILSRYTSGVDFFWTHSVLLYLDRMGDIEESVSSIYSRCQFTHSC